MHSTSATTFSLSAAVRLQPAPPTDHAAAPAGPARVTHAPCHRARAARHAQARHLLNDTRTRKLLPTSARRRTTNKSDTSFRQQPGIAPHRLSGLLFRCTLIRCILFLCGSLPSATWQPILDNVTHAAAVLALLAFLAHAMACIAVCIALLAHTLFLCSSPHSAPWQLSFVDVILAAAVLAFLAHVLALVEVFLALLAHVAHVVRFRSTSHQTRISPAVTRRRSRHPTPPRSSRYVHFNLPAAQGVDTERRNGDSTCYSGNRPWQHPPVCHCHHTDPTHSFPTLPSQPLPYPNRSRARAHPTHTPSPRRPRRRRTHATRTGAPPTPMTSATSDCTARRRRDRGTPRRIPTPPSPPPAPSAPLHHHNYLHLPNLNPELAYTPTVVHGVHG